MSSTKAGTRLSLRALHDALVRALCIVRYMSAPAPKKLNMFMFIVQITKNTTRAVCMYVWAAHKHLRDGVVWVGGPFGFGHTPALRTSCVRDL